MADDLDIEGIFKLKVEGLKTELAKRGLPKSGSKAELQERLLNHFTTKEISEITSNKDEDGFEETTEDEDLKNELEASLDKVDTPTALTADDKPKELTETPELEPKQIAKEQKTNVTTKSAPVNIAGEKLEKKNPTTETTPPAKVNIGTKPLTETEKIEQRGMRFGSVSETEKKKARLERFGNNTSIKGSGNGSTGDKLAQRAARFGGTTGSTSSELDKRKQRQDRFLDDKIKKRQERFGVVQPTKPNTTDLEMRKKQRALKFGLK